MSDRALRPTYSLRMDRRSVLAGSFGALVLGKAWPAKAGRRPVVVTTIAQLAEPLRVIAGQRIDISSLMGEGVDPHLYRPTRSDMARLARADGILWSGLHLEAQMIEVLEKLAHRRRGLAAGEATGAKDLLDWQNGLKDPHVWMDPALWRLAISASVEVLAEIDRDGAAVYRRNRDEYFARLEAVAAYTKAAIGSIPETSRILVTAHDAFGYFGRRFGIEVLGIQGISTESEAGLHRVERLVATLVERRIPAVFIETSVSERNIRALIEGAAARGHKVRLGGSLYSDAMGAPGRYEGTYIGMLDHNATTIARALGGSAPEGGMSGFLSHAS